MTCVHVPQAYILLPASKGITERANMREREGDGGEMGERWERGRREREIVGERWVGDRERARERERMREREREREREK